MRETAPKIRRIEGLADDGSRVTIVEFGTVTFRHTVNGKLTTIDGPVRWALTDGSQVNRVEDKTYKVFSTRQVLRDIG
jgi:hypothetical protein